MLVNADCTTLKSKANLIRQDIINMLSLARSGHSAGSLGMADIFTSLYFQLLHHRPKQAKWEERDRLILSNGHICPVWYATLAEAGYFDKNLLSGLRHIDSELQGHPHRKSLPGIENTSGPLGQGVSIAVGIALAAKRSKKEWHTICITSDGEQNEGQTWEAYLFSCKYKLDNLIFIMDRNRIQIGGDTESVMPLEPLKRKLENFGIFVLEVDGHNFEEIADAYYKALTIKNKPTIIIAHTIPGKGVMFMEGKSEWHGRVPDDKEVKEAINNLKFTI